MIKKCWYITLMVGAVLLLAGLACGSSVPDLEEVLPGGDEVDSAGTGEEEEMLVYPGTDVTGLSSYRISFALSYSGTDENGNQVNETLTVNEAFSSNPSASYIKWEGTQGTSGGSSEIAQIGEVSYIVTDDGSGGQQCLTFSQQDSVPEQRPPISPDSFLGGNDLSKAQRIRPDEMVNGVMARHYRVTPVEAVLVGLSNYTVDIWLAVDGGYVVRETLSADGTLVTLGSGMGHIDWTYDLLDVNGPVDIQPPSGCEAPIGSDFPKMPDASEVNSIASMLSYKTASPPADVVTFYQTQLPMEGWTAGESSDFSGIYMLEFSRGDEHVSITISATDGLTDVMVSFQ
ncbi:MAG: hypothetical protein JXB30_15375 [Anaerolineae bacterium]|nr:hypothetical protein [Anaerolineae bacterium]